MVDWPILFAGLIALVPGLLVLLYSFAPYDGHFRDNILFLFFMGGLFAGMAVVVFEILLLLPPDPLYRIGMVLLGIPLMEQLLKLLALNRKKHQGGRETAFFGGSFAVGFASMVVLFKAQRDIPMLMYQSPGALLADPSHALYLLVVGSSVMLAHFATGLLIGDGVRTRRLAHPLLLAVLALVPVQFLAFEFSANLQAGRPLRVRTCLLYTSPSPRD